MERSGCDAAIAMTERCARNDGRSRLADISETVRPFREHHPGITFAVKAFAQCFCKDRRRYPRCNLELLAFPKHDRKLFECITIQREQHAWPPGEGLFDDVQQVRQ